MCGAYSQARLLSDPCGIILLTPLSYRASVDKLGRSATSKIARNLSRREPTKKWREHFLQAADQEVGLSIAYPLFRSGESCHLDQESVLPLALSDWIVASAFLVASEKCFQRKSCRWRQLIHDIEKILGPDD